jgi:lysophospholipase L1-like esterase
VSRRSVLAALLVAALATVMLGVVGRPALAEAKPVRILPLGDSITAGTGCWRAFLWHRLETTGYRNIDFVGSMTDGGGCNPGYGYDTDHEGHGGFSATGIADQNQLPGWLASARPDVVLVHLGTNDMWGGHITLAAKLAAFTKLVGQMRANNPDVKILVAQIIPISRSVCSTCSADVVAFDEALPGWAAGLTTARSPIVLVDQWTGFDAVADNTDGIHPSNAGYQKMADRWYPALAKVLDELSGAPAPSPAAAAQQPVTAQPPVTATVNSTTSTSQSSVRTAAPIGGCTAVYSTVARWREAFAGRVVVQNDTVSRSTAWKVRLGLADGQRLVYVWNATSTGNGSKTTVRNVRYNGSLRPGAAVTFSFVASGNNAGTSSPTVSCTLG